ncbi:MAG: hypothetical protein KAS07_02970, partial [Candidatus Pacebacteria bacterium]|nr:hypothetical protein [Candidatus Paceibacterota bacterium]
MINENKHSKFVYAILALIPLTIFLAMCVLQSIDKEYSEASNVSGKNVLVTELQRGTENNSQERPLYGKGSEACQKYDCARIWEQWEEN